MSGKIFINYRRGDEPGFAQALFGRLEQAFPADKLFMDVDGIEPGRDFVQILEQQVAISDVMLSVIGKAWIDARDDLGTRRLDNPEDYVRMEIASALEQGKRVIPVLVGEARMPHSEELPEAIRPLARRNAVRLTHERFRADAQGLVQTLQHALDEAAALRSARAEAETRRKHEEVLANERTKAQREAELQARMSAVGGLSAEQIAKAEELANWEFIKDRTDPEDFRDHLARFPGGVCARMARYKLAGLAWAALGEAPGQAALTNYLDEFADGAHSEQARAQLAMLDHAAEQGQQEKAEAETLLREEERRRLDEDKRRSGEIEIERRAEQDFGKTSDVANMPEAGLHQPKPRRIWRWIIPTGAVCVGMLVILKLAATQIEEHWASYPTSAPSYFMAAPCETCQSVEFFCRGYITRAADLANKNVGVLTHYPVLTSLVQMFGAKAIAVEDSELIDSSIRAGTIDCYARLR
jgi:TIR domain